MKLELLNWFSECNTQYVERCRKKKKNREIFWKRFGVSKGQSKVDQIHIEIKNHVLLPIERATKSQNIQFQPNQIMSFPSIYLHKLRDRNLTGRSFVSYSIAYIYCRNWVLVRTDTRKMRRAKKRRKSKIYIHIYRRDDGRVCQCMTLFQIAFHKIWYFIIIYYGDLIVISCVRGQHVHTANSYAM